MKALVTGGRGRTKRKTVNAALSHYAPTTIIVAEPAGPAAFAAEWAEKQSIPVLRLSVETAIAEGEPDLLVIFDGHHQNSSSQLHRAAQEAGVRIVKVAESQTGSVAA